MKFSSMLTNLAADLNDAASGHEFTTWTREQVGAYLEEAIQTIFTERPDLFTETRIVKVTTCSVLQDTCDCTHILRVYGQSTKDGRIIKELRPKSSDDKLRWTGRVCPTPLSNFELKEYAIDKAKDKLWLYPLVPPNLELYVSIECAVIPNEFTEDYEIPSEIRAMIMQWVLFRAKMVDGENNSLIFEVAKAHESTFWRLIQSQKASEELLSEKEDD